MDIISKVKRAFGFTQDDGDFDHQERDDARTIPYVNPFRKQNNGGKQQQTTETERRNETLSLAHDNAELAAVKTQLQQLTGMVRAIQHTLTHRPEPEPEQPHQSTQEPQDSVDVKQKLKESEAKRRSAQQQVEQTNELVEQLKVKVATLENDKKGLLNKIRVMEVKAGGDGSIDTTNAIEQMMEQHHTELQEKDQQIAQLKDDLQRLTAEKESFNVVNNQLNELIEQKEAQLLKLNEELNEANESLEIAEQVQQKLEEVEQFKQRKNEEILSLKQALQEQQQQLEKQQQAQQEVEKLNKTISRLQAQAKDTADKCKRRDIDVANHIDALKQQLASAATVVEQQRAQQEVVQQEIVTLKRQCDDARLEVKKTAEQRDEAQTQAEQMRRENVALVQQVDQLRKQLEQLSSPPVADKAVAEDEPEVPYAAQQSTEGKGVMTTLVDDKAHAERSETTIGNIDQLDDIDWLLPVQPDQPAQPELELELELELESASPVLPAPDPRQLSLF